MERREGQTCSAACPRDRFAPRAEDPSVQRDVKAPDGEPARSTGQGQATTTFTQSPCTELHFGPSRYPAARPLHEKAIQLQRASLNKVATAYRDVTAEMPCLLSGTPPLDLLAMQRLVLYR